MKTLYTNVTNVTNVLAMAQKQLPADSGVNREANSELKQRLWQLLLPLPEKAALLETSAPATNTTSDQRSEREAHTRSASGELAATAYLLAGHLQQLSLFDAARAEHTTATRAPALSQQSVQVRVDANTANGGLASIELSHPELGQVGLAIELADGAVRITATATSARSAEVIQQGQALLAQRLLHQGVVLEALDVVVVRKRKPAKRANRAQQRARKEES